MRTVEGNGGFEIAIADDGHVKLNDPRCVEALEAAVKDAPGAIALWYDHKHETFRAAEIYGTLPSRGPAHPPTNLAPTTHEVLDYNTATFGVGKSLTEALRYLLGYFWIKAEDQ